MADRGRLFPPAPRARVPVAVDCRPWYKENLPSKSFMKHKSGLTCPTSLNSRQWRFVRTGLDDFRKGCPPCEDPITRGLAEGFLPKIYHRAPRPTPKRRHNMLPRDAALCSKLSPAQQARKAFLVDVEAQLTPHPLALYPDLEEDMPAELLLKVLDMLDPEQKLEDTWAYCQGITKRVKEPTKLFKKRSTLEPPKKTPMSHSGQWLYEEKKPSETDLLHKDGPLLHENGSPNIDEEFILKQFDIDYQSKPSYNVLHTMRPNQVPVELKKGIGLNKLQKPQFFQKLDYEQRLQKPQNPYKPKWVKMRYGAWYLNTKLWKKLRAYEPLVDPKVLRQAQDGNFKKKLQEQELLADLHGTGAFKDFILSRGYRMPTEHARTQPWEEGLAFPRQGPRDGIYHSALFILLFIFSLLTHLPHPSPIP
ncbi:protein FAM47E isoform X1 [Camelus bactrianus]|uniref:Protein FAM47E isoform X1 n=1 Tax=Camelus bactrianus TaxID=9837 RepID=A0AC58NV16_CAMBA